MAVDARKLGIEFTVGMIERKSLRDQILQFETFALRNDGMARRAITRFELFTRHALVSFTMTAETSGPIFVANIVRIEAPIGLPFGEDRL
jgi:hypothetical protein